MKIGSNSWMDLVRDGASQMGIEVNPEQAAQIAHHGQLLVQWNKRINLTTITDAKDVAIKHVIDAIAPLNYIPSKGHLLDIGTGGGYPGIPLKIMRPSQPMTLIDSVRKKVNFLKNVIRQLHLDSISAIHTRAEEMLDALPETNKFNIIVCRALANPQRAISLAAPLLLPNGRIILYLGPQEGSEIVPDDHYLHNLDEVKFRHESISYQLPFSDFSRRILILKS